jgi:hypothetical protein
MSGWMSAKEKAASQEAAREAAAEEVRRWLESLRHCRCREPVADLRRYLGRRVCRLCGRVMT